MCFFFTYKNGYSICVCYKERKEGEKDQNNVKGYHFGAMSLMEDISIMKISVIQFFVRPERTTK